MNWMQVAEYLERDRRAVVPLGSVEQHAYLSLATDALLAERVAVEAAEPLGVVVFPVIAYGITPSTLAYPGSVSLRVSTDIALVRDVLDSLESHGFRRLVLVNGHGGNSPIASLAAEWMSDHPKTKVVVQCAVSRLCEAGRLAHVVLRAGACVRHVDERCADDDAFVAETGTG